MVNLNMVSNFISLVYFNQNKHNSKCEGFPKVSLETLSLICSEKEKYAGLKLSTIVVVVVLSLVLK